MGTLSKKKMHMKSKKAVKEVNIIKTKSMPMEVENIEVVENLVKRLEERELDIEGNVREIK